MRELATALGTLTGAWAILAIPAVGVVFLTTTLGLAGVALVWALVVLAAAASVWSEIR